MKPPSALRNGAVAAALALFLHAAVPLHAQQPLADDDGVADALHLLNVWMDAAQAYRGIPGASLSVVHDQEVVWAKGYGYAHVEREEAATAETMYSICSISKLFTSVGVLQLRDQGKVDLDDPVGKHLEWFEMRDQDPEEGAITVEGLLTHTSGLPREVGVPYWTGPDYPFPTHEEIVATVSTQSMLYPPRTYYQYSNLALTLAGEIVAAASGRAYDDYIRANILDPLGMTSTFTDLEDRFRGNRLASGYTLRGRDGKRQLVPDYWVRGISPAAGFISTVEDLARFASWQFRVLDGDDELLDRNTLREMHRVHWLEPDGETTYGLGFSVWKSDGDTFVGHGGSCPGYRSHLLLRPQDEIATVFMTNGQGVNARRFAQTAYDIVAPALRKAAGKTGGAGAAGESAASSGGRETAAREALTPFTGTYQRPLGGEAAVLIREGELQVLPLPTDDPLEALTRLRHIEDGTFRRVRDDGELGEEFVFEEMPDGRMLMWRNDNYSIREPGI
ncbi:MAG: beta-lactamase family protein [Acidobacteria bacterium]|nr:beta-lactamase family protein [Acidobacteriota bacterium]MYJ04734.1 beta-lactamase family protein [Acidobacteriota bacterium]